MTELVKWVQDVKGLSESDQQEVLKSVIPKVQRVHVLKCFELVVYTDILSNSEISSMKVNVRMLIGLHGS